MMRYVKTAEQLLSEHRCLVQDGKFQAFITTHIQVMQKAYVALTRGLNEEGVTSAHRDRADGYAANAFAFWEMFRNPSSMHQIETHIPTFNFRG